MVSAPLIPIEPQPTGLLAEPWLAKNPHRGSAPSARTLHRAIAFSKPLTASGFEACVYDFGRRSRSTGKVRDNETGLDFFGARYFGGAQGRFTSPDPKILTARHLTNPQKWNKYAYVTNNPLAMIDPEPGDRLPAPHF